MDSLSTAGQIWHSYRYAKMSTRRSVRAHFTTAPPVDVGQGGDTVDDSAHPLNLPLAINGGNLAPQDVTHNQSFSSSWPEEMDIQDPFLDNDEPTSSAATIKVVPMTDRAIDFLTEAFTQKMTGVERQTMRSRYTLPQNDLTQVPFLDAMMSSKCSRSTKSTDHSLYTLQGLLLEVVEPLSQLLEAVNDPEPKVTMDQIGDAVQTAISLLANAANKMSLMRRARILEEYNKELVPFAAAQERHWASAAPRLFGPNFLKEAADYLQQIQLIRKGKSKLPQGFWQPPQAIRGRGGKRSEVMETAAILSPDQPTQKDLSCGEESSPEEMTSNYMHTQCVDITKLNYYCQYYVGQGVQKTRTRLDQSSILQGRKVCHVLTIYCYLHRL